MRVLIVSTMLAPELNEYPDSGNLWARNYSPSGEPGEEAVELITRPEAGVDYLDGEVGAAARSDTDRQVIHPVCSGHRHASLSSNRENIDEHEHRGGRNPLQRRSVRPPLTATLRT